MYHKFISIISFKDIIPYPLSHIFVHVNTKSKENISYTDCFECSILRIIQLLILDLSGYENIDVSFLKTKTTNIKLINFFEKYPICGKSIFENVNIRSEWSSLLNEISDIYYHRDIHGELSNNYNGKYYEIDTIIENFINIFWYFFNMIDWEKYNSIMPIKRFMDINRYQIFLDLITKNFMRENYTVKIHMTNLYKRNNNMIKSHSNHEIEDFFNTFYGNNDIILMDSMITVNNENIWKWMMYSLYDKDDDNLIDGHSEITSIT